MKRTLSALASLAIAATALIALPAGAQAATPAYPCYWTGQQSTFFYGAGGVNAWMSQPMGYAYYATDCYAGGTYGSSDSVKTIQDALNHCNGANLEVDGSYGPLTKAAVRAVQASHGITVDGAYGPQTRDHMSWWAVTSLGHGQCWSRY